MRIHRRKERQVEVSTERYTTVERVKPPKKAIGFLLGQVVLSIVAFPITTLTGKNLTDFGRWLEYATTPKLGWMLYHFGWVILVVANIVCYMTLLLFAEQKMREWKSDLEKKDSSF